ncbi:UPF0701 protein YloC [Chlamydiales bacterium SCGC AB-751-O23]|jgi:uncharacterized protein (TIGR00255 family)|nr:UPF0701 protein YloC [Chlamydiales bacterium SCGC AB-751-O23]
MSIKSMTAYSNISKDFSFGELTCQIQTLNKRFLDVACNLPKELSYLELLLRKKISERVKRGKVSLSITLNFSREQELVLTPNVEVLKQVQKLGDEAAKTLNMPDEVKWSLIERLLTREKDWVKTSASSHNQEELEEAIDELVSLTVDKLLEMKMLEGDYLAKDLLGRTQSMKDSLKKIESLSENASVNYRIKLLDRLKKADLDVDLEDERILKELCLFAERVDISEEITRFTSHLVQFEGLLKNPDEIVGKKLDFIIQELGREANTIGSKTPLIEVSKEAIEIKTELEKVREQVQNIE